MAPSIKKSKRATPSKTTSNYSADPRRPRECQSHRKSTLAKCPSANLPSKCKYSQEKKTTSISHLKAETSPQWCLPKRNPTLAPGSPWPAAARRATSPPLDPSSATKLQWLGTKRFTNQTTTTSSTTKERTTFMSWASRITNRVLSQFRERIPAPWVSSNIVIDQLLISRI